jgi:hypothetical protein
MQLNNMLISRPYLIFLFIIFTGLWSSLLASYVRILLGVP